MTSPTPSEERDVAGNLDIVDQLSVKAAMINMGEKIAWRSEVDLMHEAAAEITRLRAEVARKDEALDRIAHIHHHNYGRQDEKLADVEPIVRAARMPAEGRAAIEQEGG